MSAGTVCKRFLVSGRVQGVFFRASTAREAGRLGLSGSVTNLSDGRVEVVASGASSKVDEFAGWLASGPPMANVTRVDVQDLDPADWPGGDRFKVG
jgi:acylphosphatase